MRSDLTLFRLPDLGEGLNYARLIQWYVGPGDDVCEDQVIAAVETDKAIVEIPSPWSGRVVELLCSMGDHVRVGSSIASFDDVKQAVHGIVTSSDYNAVGSVRKARTLNVEAPLRMKVVPAARLRARALNVDLQQIQPTGPNSTITVQDVERAAAKGLAAQHVVNGKAAGKGVAFLYGARDALWLRIGDFLYDGGGVIRDSLRQSGDFIERRLGWSLERELRSATTLPEHVVDTANTAVQLALSDAWFEREIRPQAVIGRCGGEIAAAYAAGLLSFGNALEAVCRIGSLIQQGHGAGRVFFVKIGASKFASIRSRCPVELWLLADDASDVDGASILACKVSDAPKFVEYLTTASVPFEQLSLAIAPHTGLIDRWETEVLRPLPEASCAGRGVSIYSATVAGQSEQQSWPGHLWDIVRHPVLIGPAVRQAVSDGFSTFVEVGGRPTLASVIGQSAEGNAVIFLPTMEEMVNVESTMQAATAALERARVMPN